uniref:Uncharacterized protein n=1 Tax=Arion vulgaris TaxID=1028688 RepID=A0A0B7BET7_9EUPU
MGGQQALCIMGKPQAGCIMRELQSLCIMGESQTVCIMNGPKLCPQQPQTACIIRDHKLS